MNSSTANKVADRWHEHLSSAVMALEGVANARWDNGAFSPDARLREAAREIAVMLDMVTEFRAADEWLYSHG